MSRTPGRRPEAAVRAYLDVVADLASTRDDLLAVLHPDVVFVEHPSPMSPHGRTHGRDGMVAGFLAGKDLLSEQQIDVQGVLVEGDRVAVQSTWTGVVRHDAGALAAGTRLTAHLAGFFTVRDGLVSRHETYDCYEPFPAPPQGPRHR
ncbi:nuclear transport factor 2 family protein [Knoellia sp. p5-6-4]|uniref:nuclear transport factor 2 family protein n=1 Tax=unclassified Knoellia TaxID=2618719 RepID=UPI0023DC66F9|nr:nuclear transport factor 2 family protein [Knoellia sp. p5-6-4]MDF2143897.1 nuclear transport factor 2 family protein [Knoellia sp. p5-6-4]